MTREDIEKQLEIEQAIYDVLTNARHERPELIIYPNWLDAQSNRVTILEHLLTVTPTRREITDKVAEDFRKAALGLTETRARGRQLDVGD